jgi:hypothetical protein
MISKSDIQDIIYQLRDPYTGEDTYLSKEFEKLILEKEEQKHAFETLVEMYEYIYIYIYM